VSKEEERRTGRVSELVLLALYPVLEGLGIATGDLDFLLDRLLVHVGHYGGRRVAGARVVVSESVCDGDERQAAQGQATGALWEMDEAAAAVGRRQANPNPGGLAGSAAAPRAKGLAERGGSGDEGSSSSSNSERGSAAEGSNGWARGMGRGGGGGVGVGGVGGLEARETAAARELKDERGCTTGRG
jgi:hypothetical protein